MRMTGVVQELGEGQIYIPLVLARKIFFSFPRKYKHSSVAWLVCNRLLPFDLSHLPFHKNIGRMTNEEDQKYLIYVLLQWPRRAQHISISTSIQWLR